MINPKTLEKIRRFGVELEVQSCLDFMTSKDWVKLFLEGIKGWKNYTEDELKDQFTGFDKQAIIDTLPQFDLIYDHEVKDFFDSVLWDDFGAPCLACGCEGCDGGCAR